MYNAILTCLMVSWLAKQTTNNDRTTAVEEKETDTCIYLPYQICALDSVFQNTNTL